ncbi:hypothetical protein EYF80_025787 [Liparis tanakae]|uniref:Uncharacterized protein n=1 Tax=Liparis tanakae TaxID=230148 RepID=A0A4Z2HF76_9TELE|nr:hypothetical protein EYF80_025787 [Liparis tanakae]
MKSYRTFTHEEYCGSGTNHGQPASRDAGEVVVLVVVAHVEGEQVEGAVVGVGLVALEEHVVLGDEVARDGVQAHPQHGAGQHVDHGLGPPQPAEQGVEGELDGHVGHLQPGDGFGVDAERPDGVEQRLQDNPDKFAQARAEEPAFELGGDVHVDPVSTQVPVVVQVVAFEGGGVGQPDGQVGEHGEVAIPQGLVVPEGRVVGDLVDSKGHRVVDAAAEAVSPEQNPFPVQIFDHVES